MGTEAVAWAILTAQWAAEQSLEEGGYRPPSLAQVDVVRHAAEACLLGVMGWPKHRSPGPPTEDGMLPPEVGESVRLAAFGGMPLWCLLRAVWLAGARITEDPAAPVALFPCADPLSSGGAGTGDGLKRLVADHVSRFSADIAQVYLVEDFRQDREVSPAAAQAVRNLLAGVPGSGGACERLLGLDFSDHHLAVVVTGAGESVGQLRRFAFELTRALGASPPLLVPRDRDAVWLLTSWQRPPGTGLTERARGAVSAPQGLQVALGSVGQGVDGIRSSLLRAQAAEKLMPKWTTSWLCGYDEIAIPALLTKDPLEARLIVEETLGELGRADPWYAELRETLRLYLAFGRSRVRVAEELYVSRNTVAYRVQKALQLLRHDLDEEDPLRVLLALEIARVLPADPAVGT
ncbi:PucR family transcriptional regulator [Streptomyces xiangluensis]|uniref:PucR family transcriptional regulator n=1 Tax=Streptomyces xiangluensis TaxID=2665720 RepID=A0ABV8YIS6_9ACTN